MEYTLNRYQYHLFNQKIIKIELILLEEIKEILLAVKQTRTLIGISVCCEFLSLVLFPIKFASVEPAPSIIKAITLKFYFPCSSLSYTQSPDNKYTNIHTHTHERINFSFLVKNDKRYIKLFRLWI